VKFLGARRKWRRAAALAWTFLCLTGAAALCWARPAERKPAGASRVTLTLLATTDLHGHVFPVSVETGGPANLGLAKIATLIARERAEHPNALLFDCGDTTQGTALAYLAARQYSAEPNPIIAAMNAVGYDAMAIGNHDFNFGLAHLAKIRREANFPVLAANVASTPEATEKPFPAYVVKTVAGIRVGIIGVVTPGTVRGENPANYRGYQFRPIVETVEQAAAELRPKVDLLVLLAHSGLGREAGAAGTPPGADANPDNAMIEVANRVPGLDVILFGHTHLEVGERFINGVLLSQAKFWGQSLAEVEIELEHAGAGSWHVAAKHSRVIPVTAEVPAEARILALDREIGKVTTQFLDRPVARIEAPLSGATARVEDSPLVEWIHQAQLEAGHADVSIATMFWTGLRLPAGTLTVRNLFVLYPYDNVLYTIEMTGAELKEALELSASYFPAWPPAPAAAGEERPLPLPRYDGDSAAGVSYVIDLTQPAGSRIRNLVFRGHPLEPGQRLLVALNHYRYYGNEKFRGRKIVREAPQHVFEALVEYASRVKEMPVTAKENWRIEPREARAALVRAAESQ
jgi:2',3'-cyclic-nucleotide 2'-phosphodiesterase/3'-nucleotidase